MNRPLVFATALFLIGAVSDLVLQAIAPAYPRVNLFAPYWEYYGTFGAAAIAGIITLIYGGIFLLLSVGIFNYFNLQVKSVAFIAFGVALAFVLGLIVDVISNRSDWLGSTLRLWYDTMGDTDASLWSGGITFAFTAFLASLVLYSCFV